MADAQLVEHVGVRRRQVGHRVLAQDQPLEHGLVDHAARRLLVGAERFEVGELDRRLDQLAVDGVEIDERSRRVGLGPEGHQDEAQRPGHGFLPE
jgi:hypothetical protein